MSANRTVQCGYRSRSLSVRTGIGGADEAPPRALHEHAVQFGLHAGELGGDVLTQRSVVAQILGRNALHQTLGLLDVRIQLGIAADVQVLEALEELGQVADGSVAKDPSLAVLPGLEPFGQMRQQLGNQLETFSNG